MADLKELKVEHEKRMRQLKNADPEQVGFLKKKIKSLEDDMKAIEASKLDENRVLGDIDLKVKGKKVVFNKIGVAKIHYGAMLKRIDQRHYLIIYNSSKAEDAEIILSGDNWELKCCQMDSYPSFEYEDLGLAITYILDKMHDKYSGKPKPIKKEKKESFDPVPKKKIKKLEIEGEDIEELKRYLTILQELKDESKGDIAKKQIQKEMDNTALMIEELKKQ
jgi:hypothetical protein